MRRESQHEKIYIYGKHALMEALTNAPHAVKKVFLSPEVNDPELRSLLKQRGLVAATLKTKEMSHMVGRDTSHQGVIAITDPGAVILDLDRFMQSITITDSTMLVLLTNSPIHTTSARSSARRQRSARRASFCRRTTRRRSPARS